MTLKALIFDVDGTLAETEEIHRRAFNETFSDFGLDWNWDRDLYKELLRVTGGKERMRFFMEAHSGSDADQALGAIPEIHAAKTSRYTSLIHAGAVELRPGVRELILEAKAEGMKLAIATTTSLPNVEALIRATWGHCPGDVFDVVAAGDEVSRKKPAPDVYLLALARLGLDPSCCIAFEDSENGLYSALAAGLGTIVTTSIYTYDQDFSGALAVLPDLGKTVFSQLDRMRGTCATLLPSPVSE